MLLIQPQRGKLLTYYSLMLLPQNSFLASVHEKYVEECALDKTKQQANVWVYRLHEQDLPLSLLTYPREDKSWLHFVFVCARHKFFVYSTF